MLINEEQYLDLYVNECYDKHTYHEHNKKFSDTKAFKSYFFIKYFY